MTDAHFLHLRFVDKKRKCAYATRKEEFQESIRERLGALPAEEIAEILPVLQRYPRNISLWKKARHRGAASSWLNGAGRGIFVGQHPVRQE